MAQPVEECVSTLLIDGNGNFNTDGMKKFEKDAELEEQGRSYGVVAIMGPQSSGKSTLLNILFHTDFKVLDARLGRLQTTKGVWLAQTQLEKSCFLVLDTEGSDSTERKDDTIFERQVALLAIATSGIVMINMWHHEIGRRDAGGWPLLTIVFQVMLRILTPRKVHLIFVLRDSDFMETPLKTLESQLKLQLEKTWNELPKPQEKVNTALHDCFEIDVVALSNHKNKREQFEMEVDTLRDRIVRILACSELTTNRTAFIQDTETIWCEIKENKDLDLPSLKVMVAKKHCSNIIQKNYENLLDDSSWIEVKNKVDSGTVVEGFGDIVSPLIDTYLSKYDMETEYFDEGVRAAKRELLKEKMLQVIEGTCKSLLKLMRDAAMKKFVNAICDGLHKKNNKMECLEKIVQDQTEYLLNEIRVQFEDAAIEQADWNHANTNLESFRNEMDNFVALICPIIKEKGDAWVEAIGLWFALMGMTMSGTAIRINTGN